MNLDMAGSSSTVIFLSLALVSSGLIARPVIHWAFDQFAKMLEKLEPSQRERADLELYRAGGLLDSVDGYAWIVFGPLLLPFAVWGAWIVLKAKLFDR